jgi:hypothetical protein
METENQSNNIAAIVKPKSEDSNMKIVKYIAYFCRDEEDENTFCKPKNIKFKVLGGDRKIKAFDFEIDFFEKLPNNLIRKTREISVNSTIQKNGDDYFLSLKWAGLKNKKDIGDKNGIKIKKIDIIDLIKLA